MLNNNIIHLGTSNQGNYCHFAGRELEYRETNAQAILINMSGKDQNEKTGLWAHSAVAHPFFLALCSLFDKYLTTNFKAAFP